MKYKWRPTRYGEFILGDYRLGFEVIVWCRFTDEPKNWYISFQDNISQEELTFEQAIRKGEAHLDKLLNKVIKE